MVNKFKHRSSASIDVLNATKELLDNNEYAIEAISSRNIKIKNLENIIQHQIIAFKEIVSRYDQMSESKKEYESSYIKIEKEYSVLYEDWKKISGELEVLKQKYDNVQDKYEIMKALHEKTFTSKIEKYANNVGGKRGAFIKIIFTPPASKILLLIIFVILFVASIVGWNPVIVALKPIFKLVY